MKSTCAFSRRVLLWDFDGTLVDTLPLVFFALKQSFLYRDERWLSDREISCMFGPPEDELIKRNFLSSSQKEKAIEMYHDLYERYHDSFAIYHRRMSVLLRCLAEEGYVHAIVTGKGRRSLAISLRKLGITGYFSTAVTGNDVENPKPHPESLRFALQKIGASPDEAIMIGDSEVDYLAAKALGIPCLVVGWYRTPTFNGEYTFVADLETIYARLTHNCGFPQVQFPRWFPVQGLGQNRSPFLARFPD
ncbi:MAG: HAD family hydrolase [Brevinematales bacterium]|nr:HAD family hydrolase [Brevinematales bacterium]